MSRFPHLPVLLQDAALVTGSLGDELHERLSPYERLSSLLFIPANISAPRTGPWARTRGSQLLVVTNQRVLIGSEVVTPDAPRWVALHYDELLAWQVAHQLLIGQLSFLSTSPQLAARAWLEFHTAGQEALELALAPLEQALLGLHRTPGLRQVAPPWAEELPGGLATGLRHTLHPEEVVRAWMFQPLLYAPGLRLRPRLLATPTILVATDRRLLVLCEAPHTTSARYGVRTWSMPRYQANNLVVRAITNLVVVEHKSNPSVLSWVFAHDYLPALQRLIARLHADQSSIPGAVTQRLGKL